MNKNENKNCRVCRKSTWTKKQPAFFRRSQWLPCQTSATAKFWKSVTSIHLPPVLWAEWLASVILSLRIRKYYPEGLSDLPMDTGSADRIHLGLCVLGATLAALLHSLSAEDVWASDFRVSLISSSSSISVAWWLWTSPLNFRSLCFLIRNVRLTPTRQRRCEA